MGGRCHFRAGGQACGMWKEEEDGVRCGLPAWIGEAEQREAGSPARRWRRCKQGVKVSTWKGRRKEGNVAFGKGGGELDISAEAENLESLQPKNWRAKCHQTRSLI